MLLDNEVTSYRVIKTWIPTVLLDNEAFLLAVAGTYNLTNCPEEKSTQETKHLD